MEQEKSKGLEDGGWKSQLIVPLILGSFVVAIGLLILLVVMLTDQSNNQTPGLIRAIPW